MKPTIVWVEQLTTFPGAEIPALLQETFQVQNCKSVEQLTYLISEKAPAAIFFEFDYPNRRQLAGFAEIKERNPSIPIVMTTLQHSESLAIWAFRIGALDYLVKPVDAIELQKCTNRILKIVGLRRSQNGRVANAVNASIPKDVPNTARTKKDRLSPAIYYVQQHYSEKIYSDAMARLCDMSPAHFSRSFKLEYGLTFQDFLIRYRVRQACRQFQASRNSISDVAYNVGFTDPSYFARVFKRYVGLSPSEFSEATGSGAMQDEHAENAADKLSSSSQIVRRLSVASFGD